MSKQPGILNRDKAGLLIIDVQRKLNAVMTDGEKLIKAISTLIEGCKAIGVPILYTEQYPEGLGTTEPALCELLGDNPPLTKMYFSSCRDTDLITRLRDKHIEQIILTGMETHICVLQTALDLVAHNFQIFVALEAVTSRKQLDRDVALERLRQNGVIITTVESILFELLETASATEFRKVQKLIK